jgi:hypothetical protein
MHTAWKQTNNSAEIALPLPMEAHWLGETDMLLPSHSRPVQEACALMLWRIGPRLLQIGKPLACRTAISKTAQPCGC